MAHSMEEIAELLRKTQFKRKFLFGIDEDDVWKKLKRLQKEYTELVDAERQRCVGLTLHWKKTAEAYKKEVAKRDELIKRLARELEKSKNSKTAPERSAAKATRSKNDD